MTGGASHWPADAWQPVSHAGRAMRGTLLAPCPGRWLSAQCTCTSRGVWEGPRSSTNLTFHFHEALSSWRVCNISGATFKLSSAGDTRCGVARNWHMCNELHPTGLASCHPGMVDALGASSPTSPSPLFFWFSQCGILHRSAFLIVCGLAPKSFCLCSFAADKAGLLRNAPTGHWPSRVPPALVPLSPQDTCEPP